MGLLDRDEELLEILLVDDNEKNLIALEACLKHSQCKLIKVTSGEAALKYLINHDVALVLLDVNMPIMDGFETAKEMKNLFNESTPPIIFLTAINESREYAEKAYEVGGFDFIYKPFDPKVLQAKVAAFARIHQARQKYATKLASEASDERKAIEEKYKDLVNGIDHAVIWSAYPEDLKFTFVSPRTNSITGYSLDEWINEPNFFLNRVPLEDHGILKKLINDALAGDDRGIEHRFIHKNGQVLWLHTGIRRARKGAGAPWEIRGLSTDVTLLKEAETNAKISEKKFRVLSNSMPQMVFIADSSANTTFLNQRWYEYTGNEEGDISSTSWARVIHPDDIPCIQKTWDKARLEGKPWVHEYRVRRHDGVYRWHLGRSVPDKDESGNVTEWVGTVTDIEDQKRNEAALQESKENLESKIELRTKELMQTNAFLDSVVENIPNMIFVKDAVELKFVRFNKAGEDLLGSQREELIGKGDYDFFPSDQAKTFQEKDRLVLSGNQIVDIPEEKIATKSGERILHTKKIPVLDANGTVQYLLGISEDITEKKKMEEERLEFLRAKIVKQEADKATERLNFLSDASAVLATSLDYETTLENLTKLAVPAIADWCSIQMVQPDRTLKQIAVAHKNPDKIKWAWELHSKYPPEADSPTGPPNVVRTGRSEMMSEIGSDLIRQAARDPEHLKILEGVGFKSYICAPIRTRGKVIGALSLVTTDESSRKYGPADLRLAEDLSDRAGSAVENSSLYKDAKNLNHVKDEFLATLSHELRSPMNVIQGHAEILKNEFKTLTSGEVEKSVDAIYRNAKTQTSLIGDLLDVSSIITGKISYKPSEINPVTTVKNILEGLQPTANAKEIKLTGIFSNAPESVLADATRLHQIIWNLATNAIKFTPKGGEVSIELSQNQQDWCIIVSDTGRGIDPEFLPYVFDRFRQEDASSTRRYGGLGLGLSIVRHLVELHGGYVKAESEGSGQGARFTAILPLKGLRQETSQADTILKVTEESVKKDLLIKLENVKVLLVDDSSDNRVIVRLILAKAGAIVIEAESAHEAREKLKTIDVDVVISDIGMPDENGIEFIRKLRTSKHENLKSLPAIALTAYVRDEEKAAALSAGFHAHVAKPISAQVLLEEIKALLKK